MEAPETLLFSAEERQRLRADFPYFSQTLLKINPKIKELIVARGEGDEPIRGPLIPFRWNKAQRIVWKVMLGMIERGVPIKIVILKARQVGISTFFCAYIFWQMWRQQHYRSATVAYEKKTTLAELNETMNTFWEGLPEGYRPKLRAHKKSGGRLAKEEVYFDDRKSKNIFAVQSPKAIRGIPLEAALCTECSFYDAADEFFGGFLPAMSDGPNSILVKESSPADGWFKDEYEAARDGALTDQVAIFIAWWMCDDIYSRAIVRRGRRMYDAKDPDLEVVLPSSLRAKQKHLSRLAHKKGLPPVSDEQMWWWLHYCESNYKGDEEWMQQEFPDDDVTAFQRASRSAFKTALTAVKRTVEEIETVFPDMAVGTLQSTTYLNPSIEQHVALEEEPYDGYIDQEQRPGLMMFEAPRPGSTYIIGADVADAEGEDDEEGERAYSVACVYCCNSRDQVGEWRGHIDPTDWGDELVKLGYFYNTAMIVVERNNMGRLTEHRIRTQLRYPRRFKWPDWNVGPEALTKKEMWETNASTKPIMIGSFRQWVRDGLFKVRSPGLQDEMAHYRVVRGKFEARDRHADRIIAASLCVMGVEQTEFAFKNIVLGANGVRESRSASGMAARVIRARQPPPTSMKELPEEFDALGLQRVGDIFTQMFEGVNSFG